MASLNRRCGVGVTMVKYSSEDLNNVKRGRFPGSNPEEKSAVLVEADEVARRVAEGRVGVPRTERRARRDDLAADLRGGLERAVDVLHHHVGEHPGLARRRSPDDPGAADCAGRVVE